MTFRILMLLPVIAASEVALGEIPGPVEEALISTRNVQLLGGWNPINPDSAEIQAAANKALEQFNSDSKGKKYFRLLDISSAESQVTNMINYKITATIGKTKCLKSDNGDLNTCDMAKKRLQCKFHVQYNPRNDELTVVATSCKR